VSAPGDPAARCRAIREAIPAGGLFDGKSWRISPEPFRLSARDGEELEKLGRRLLRFYRACDLLYLLSTRGKRPAWVAELFDRGKPPELIERARAKAFQGHLPAVIRPDLVLGERGFAIAELDSVPGGIGLTAWLNATYAGLGAEVVGGPTGMLDGFRAIFPRGEILVSREASDYRPEMEWIAARSGGELRVADAEGYASDPGAGPRAVYRFFELFDLPNIPGAEALAADALAGRATVTPPLKPWLEEKLWLALLWLRPLEDFWLRELGERDLRILRGLVPQSWVLDPAPLPYHAAIPGLEIHAWRELEQLGNKGRELILKISGFSDRAWGSRGVVLGADLPRHEWAAAVERALGEFAVHPHVLQRFVPSRVVEHPVWDEASGEVRPMRGRVRLSPYYFVEEGEAVWRGALATICPPDKKLLHGMKDAALVPCAVDRAE
jgi:hypothetical protein